jgi:hypothetical protein
MLASVMGFSKLWGHGTHNIFWYTLPVILHHSLDGTVMRAMVDYGSDTLAAQDKFIYHTLWGF